MKGYPSPTRVYRVGRAGAPWDLADWKYGPFNGRFDDPDAAYRVRYVALTRVGAFIERLAKNRPDLDALATMAEIAATTPVAVPTLPREWLDENEVGTAEIDVPHDNGLVDLATGEGMAAAHLAIDAACRRAGYILKDYDASVLLSGTPRAFTQAISRYVFDSGFAGIVYRSRYAPDELCVALFEGRHRLTSTDVTTIVVDDPDLARGCAIHHLAFATPAARNTDDADDG